MAQDPSATDTGVRPKRRRAPRKTPGNAQLEAGLASGAVALDPMGYLQHFKSGSLMETHRFFGPDAVAYRISGDTDHILPVNIPVDARVLATSSMTPIAYEADEVFEGASFSVRASDGTGATHLIYVPGQAPTDEEREQEADELLKAARNAETQASTRSAWQRFEEAVFSGAVDALGGAPAMGIAVRDEGDLLRAVGLGFPASVLTSLREAGLRNDDLEGVIAPRRTLARRKAGDQRLTRVESDAAWRIAHVLSLGALVLRGPEAAVAWLRRPKAALADKTPIELIETAVGARAVERLLRQLEWGDVA